MYFSAGAEGRISYGHVGRTNLFLLNVQLRNKYDDDDDDEPRTTSSRRVVRRGVVVELHHSQRLARLWRDAGHLRPARLHGLMIHFAVERTLSRRRDGLRSCQVRAASAR